MQDDAEEALIAIANPINWIWTPDGKGVGGRWNGHMSQVEYKITSPLESDAVDGTLLARSWRLSLRSGGTFSFDDAPVPTAERAKEICLYHALSQDDSEIRALAEIGRAEATTYHAHNDSALSVLTELLRTCKPPHLYWHPKAPDDFEIYADSSRGTYAICFHPEQRWVATFTGLDQTVAKRRFHTRLIVGLACALHSHTGDWHATLSKQG